MHPKSELHFIEYYNHRHWHMSGPYYISSFFSTNLQKNKGHCFTVLDLATSMFKQPRRVVQSNPSKFSLQDSLQKINPTNLLNSLSKPISKRFIKSRLVGVSSEPQDIKQQKPEFRIPFQPIRRELRPETSKFSLRQRLNAHNS